MRLAGPCAGVSAAPLLMQRLSEPSEHVGRFEQRTEQDDRDPEIALVGRERQDQLPFRKEAGEGWQSRNRDDESAEHKDRGGTSGQQRPIPQARLADITRKPEQPDLGEQVIDEQPADHEQHRGFAAGPVQQRRGHRQQRHLADRRVAEQPLRLGLPQSDEIGEHEGDRAERRDQRELVLEQRQQLQERKKHAGRNAARDHRRHIAARCLIDIEPPAVRRERLQFEQQTGQQEDQRRDPDRACDRGAVRDQVIDIQEFR